MDEKAINVLKSLAIDMVQTAKGGHLGISLGAAPIMYTLFAKNINVYPPVYNWVNRDRFILSAGHASALLYSMMFLSGYPLTIEDLKNYRHLNSKTPGHPEISTMGVDVSTGALGEGFATAVGIALAEKIYEEKFNQKKKNAFDKKTKQLVDYYTYVLVSDGDLMEGISYESASLAGTWKLGKLIVLYDSNNVSLDGKIDNVFNEDVMGRFSSMGWHTQVVNNGKSVSDIDKAIKKAKGELNRPSIIKVNTKIGEGSLLEGTSAIHSSILSKEDLEQLKKKLEMTGLPFTILKEPAGYIRDQVIKRGTAKYSEWENTFNEYKTVLNSESIKAYSNIELNNVDIDLTNVEIDIDYNNKELLRDSNSRVMNVLSNLVDNFIGGNADVASSTKAYINNKGDISSNNYLGKNINYGVRENAMGAISNGLALSGFRPYASTYLVFSDYLRPSIRMSALMNLPVTYIFTHDSVTIGSDGPTHQPVEHLASLRAIPNLYVYRPGDIKEVIGTWNSILNSKKPSVISLPRTEVKAEQGTNILGVSKGAYIAGKDQGKIDAVVIATGSELQVAKSLQEQMKSEGIDLRIVSMPCMELYLMQDQSYKNELFPSGKPIFVLEYGSSYCWEKFVLSSEYLFNINEFGKSGSKEEIINYFNVDLDQLSEKIKSLL